MKLFVTEGDDYYMGATEQEVYAHIQKQIGPAEKVGDLTEVDPFEHYTFNDDLRRVLIAEAMAIHIRNDGDVPVCIATENC